MRYEVEISVLAKDGNTAETFRSIRQAWDFGDNPRWILAGEAFVVQATAQMLADRINHERIGSTELGYPADILDTNSGNPTKARY